MDKTLIKDIGEFEFIDRLTKDIKTNLPETKLGIGDDAAVVFNSEQTVITTDMLVEGIHFDMTYTPLKHLGYKAIAVNVSDVCAMNATPTHITVSLAISSKYTVEAIEELYKGINLACETYNVDLIGGDTTSNINGLVISVTAIGKAKKDNITKRSGANEKDLLVVSGDLGGAYVGLLNLQQEKEVWKVNPNHQPDFSEKEYVLQRQLKPEARKDIVELLDKLNVVPTSMIDISDGLASEVKHLCKHSKLGCRVYENKLPIDPTTYRFAREFNLDPSTCVLNGGEDYELLMSIKPSDYDKIKGNPNLTVIGYFTDENDGVYLETNSENLIEIQAQGWDSFKEN